MNFTKLTREKLISDELVNLVSSASCGAISLFIGTTRDNFENKTVVHLEYEAYDTMALKCLDETCNDIREKFGVENIAIYHRLGVVPTKEASIIIAISSTHRDAALKATQYAIDSVKKCVPIWKKEFYEDGNSQWKSNENYVVIN